MFEIVKWILIIGFGVLFMGFDFFLYLFGAYAVMLVLVLRFPKWFGL